MVEEYATRRVRETMAERDHKLNERLRQIVGDPRIRVTVPTEPPAALSSPATRNDAGDQCPSCGYEYGHTVANNKPVLTHEAFHAAFVHSHSRNALIAAFRAALPKEPPRLDVPLWRELYGDDRKADG
jgi:hypothetical protein